MDKIPNYSFILCDNLSKGNSKVAEICKKMGVLDICSVKVIHSTRAYGIIVTHPKWKFV